MNFQSREEKENQKQKITTTKKLLYMKEDGRLEPCVESFGVFRFDGRNTKPRTPKKSIIKVLNQIF